MNTTLKLFLASLFPCALIVGCFAPVEPGSEQENEEPVAAVQQPLPANEVWTTYYSDETFSQVVGRYHFWCSGQRTKTGTTSDYFAQTSESCDDGSIVLYPTCTICDEYLGVDGVKSCVTMACPPSIAF
jgi:hypothetical protein